MAKNKKLLKDFLNVIGILGIILALVGIILAILKIIGIF